MLIVYDTMLGKTKKFAEKLSDALAIPAIPLSAYSDHEPFVLITYTINFGEVPNATSHFLEQHASKLLGVASGGNRVWGDNFGRAADLISARYHVPVLQKFELEGNPSDINLITERLGELNETFRTER